MTSRIERGWRHRFRSVLEKVRPRRLEFGVELLMSRARALAETAGRDEAFLRVHEFTRWRVQRRLEKTGACWVAPTDGRDLFACDLSLGGLARWLRAAGFEAAVGGTEEAIAYARADGIGLTSDVEPFERKERGALLWVPSGLEPPRQMGLVLRDLGLAPRTPRCMACGGTLRAVAKDAVAERIPPRTARWKDEYFVCERCDRLFWQGTHWERIAVRIEAERPAAEDPGRP
ncbi:MAG TPA: Mut7-C RNAse domain-containing protein [Vicinamibacteria bacterium]|nr:Mut7-C RNAse domain-containing protein [Vicinamibacteria bacterium]